MTNKKQFTEFNLTMTNKKQFRWVLGNDILQYFPLFGAGLPNGSKFHSYLYKTNKKQFSNFNRTAIF